MTDNKPPMLVSGMYGIGDNIHQRGVMRELMKTHDVWLESPIVCYYHDLMDSGLKVLARHTSLRAQAANVLREWNRFSPERPPLHRATRRIGYISQVKRYGTLLRAMYASVGLEMGPQPDFSMPVLPIWRERARDLIKSWCPPSEPLLIYRPVVLRKEYFAAARNPDPIAYAALFADLRKRFFVVSIAALKPGHEWIIGPQEKADVNLNHSELDLEIMAGLFAEAECVYTTPGFAPTLAQAVGTPSITIFGGAETFGMTLTVGQHLAPTLGIDSDAACGCYNRHHHCDKRITIAPAKARIEEFLRENVPALS
jgi:ADP-heptose:LPS heptosyltransferase